jgi:hypothetical protein
VLDSGPVLHRGSPDPAFDIPNSTGARQVGSRIHRAGAAVAIAWACLGPCRANPVPVDAGVAPADADRSAPGPAAIPAASMPLVGSSRGTLTGELAQERADALATARDPALLPIDMQGVGAQAHPAPSALPKAQGDNAGVDDGGLRKFATSARDWMRDVFGKPDNPQDNLPADGQPGVSGAPDLGLPAETQASGVSPMAQRAARSVEMPPPGAGPHRATAAAPAHDSAGARLLAESAPEYSIQQFLKRCREVLVHPLTWLAIVLIGATHILMSRGRR